MTYVYDVILVVSEIGILLILYPNHQGALVVGIIVPILELLWLLKLKELQQLLVDQQVHLVFPHISLDNLLNGRSLLQLFHLHHCIEEVLFN